MSSRFTILLQKSLIVSEERSAADPGFSETGCCDPWQAEEGGGGAPTYNFEQSSRKAHCLTGVAWGF